MTVTERYRTLLEGHGFIPDTAQQRAAERLDALACALEANRRTRAPSGLVARLLGKPQRQAVRGVYLWGSVGRGKTMLVDLFVAAVGVRARRSHFHRFMQDVHSRLQALRQSAHSDPLAAVAREIAGEIDLLSFDELYVNDIADAMILGGLFQGLVDAGVTLVFTSNVPPSGLYKDGLQRDRFLPTITLLERVTEVVEVDAGIDYRLRCLERAPMYSHADPDADSRLSARFEDLAMSDGDLGGEIQIEGRVIAVRRHHLGAVWFDFDALCQGPRGTDDYIAIARQFHTVMISNVPAMSADDNAARRFIALVDEFYERAVKLLMSTAVPIEQLYTGERLSFEFRRTISRLTEMQSRDYLGLPHRM